MDINEIARLAGVSRATVSRYLNNGYVSQAKREQIARVIEETGYVPSRQAQQLRTGRTNLVGVIIPKINSQSVSRMVAGITEVLTPKGYQVLLADTDNNEQLEVQFLHTFAEKNHVDGIILIATIVTEAHAEAFAAFDAPIVVLGQHIEGQTCVYHDDYHAALDVSRATLKGSRCPAYIGVIEEDVAAGHMRHQGFLDACAEAGITPREDLQVVSDFTPDSGFLCCETIMDRAPECDAIVCATDTIAFGALTCLREYGHRVPDDVQVSGIGDSEFSRIVYPSLTTAHLFYKSSGSSAAQMLLNCIEGKPVPKSQELKMGYEIHIRTSTR